MIVNPIAIATKGVYANERMVALPTFGYADLDGQLIIVPAGASGVWLNKEREDEDLMMIILAFLNMRK